MSSAARGGSLSLRPRVSLPKARAHVRLLGPCFKTGRTGPSLRPSGSEGFVPPAGTEGRPRRRNGRGRPRPCRKRKGVARAPSGTPDPLGRPEGASEADPIRPRRAPEDLPEAPRPKTLRAAFRPRTSRFDAGREPPSRASRLPSPPEGRGRKGGAPEGGLRPTSTTTVGYVFLVTISSAFDPLHRVLFTFPSQYFFAIGLALAFSLGWDRPPA